MYSPLSVEKATLWVYLWQLWERCLFSSGSSSPYHHPLHPFPPRCLYLRYSHHLKHITTVTSIVCLEHGPSIDDTNNALPPSSLALSAMGWHCVAAARRVISLRNFAGVVMALGVMFVCIGRVWRRVSSLRPARERGLMSHTAGKEIRLRIGMDESLFWRVWNE